MALYFKTPLGNLVPTAGLQPAVVGSQVQWNASFGENLPNPGAAAAYLSEMLARLMAVTVATTNYVDDLSALWLYNAGTTSGTTFNPATDTITVTGAGFNAATLGLIHIEDGAGGQDDNGLTMLPAFVSSTMLTAVLNTAGTNGGFGDGAPFTNSTTSTPGPIILYYEDSNSITSNNLLGTVDGGSNVTMAQ